MKKKNKYIHETVFYWLPIVIWCGIIFYLSSVPNLQIESWGWKDFVLRKIAHMVEYGGLSILVARLAYKRKCKSPWKIGILFAFLYAISDEYHQTFVEGRKGSIVDVGIDTVGMIIATILHHFFILKKNKERKGRKSRKRK